ncbi:MAG: glycosyltransferase [Candidatus Cloacimonadia bacterium]
MIFIIALFTALLLIGGVSIALLPKGSETKKRSFSITVVAKNEENRIEALLNSLLLLDYPKELYEIILVDDCSTDNTLQLFKEFAEKFTDTKIISIDEKEKKLAGKKEGLQRALDIAKNEIFLLTDADCTVQHFWLDSVSKYWDEDTVMLVGYAPEEFDVLSMVELSLIDKVNFAFRRFCQIATSGLFAATIGLGIPFSCYGRNLAISKLALLAVGGYKSIGTDKAGDDKQALNLIKKTRGKIRYSPVKNVISFPELVNFREQQKRKYGKVKQSPPLFFLATIFLLSFLIVLPVWLIATTRFIPVITLYFAALIAWLFNLAKHQERFHPLDPIFVIVYPYFMLYYTLLGSSGKWTWKE